MRTLSRGAVWLGLVFIGLHLGAVQALELMRWERLPLTVPLVIGQERVIFVDQTVRVGHPQTLASKLRVQSAGGAVYLLASDTIEPTRLQLQTVDSGEIILLDVTATHGEQPLEPIRIVKAPSQPRANGELTSQPPTEPKIEETPAHTPVPVALTRYAAQNLYAPLRTVEPLPDVRRVPVMTDSLPHLLPTEHLSSLPLAAWRLDDYWVTAVKLTNQGRVPILLDPRQLQASLFATSFQHTFLGPAGTPEDTTVAYLITRGAELGERLWSPPTFPSGDTP
jgi:integrating conjugative element protein (TIGR03749 family)